MRRDRMDGRGTAIMLGLTLLFGFNQVSIRISNDGYNPLLAAGLRSAIATVCVIGWILLRRLPFHAPASTWAIGAAMGTIFAFEFLCIYLSLDYTTVTRSTVLVYTMPVWLAIAAHVLIPGEQINAIKGAGLLLAFAGMVLAIVDQGSVPAGRNTLPGDLLALSGALGWAAIAMVARKAGSIGIAPQMQLLWMVSVSAPILILLAPAFGDLLREPGPGPTAAVIFQGVVVVAGGFLIWFHMLATYPAAGVASFAFLTPIVGLFLGWSLLGEPVGWGLALAGGLVAAGLLLVNWPARPAAGPA